MLINFRMSFPSAVLLVREGKGSTQISNDYCRIRGLENADRFPALASVDNDYDRKDLAESVSEVKLSKNARAMICSSIWVR